MRPAPREPSKQLNAKSLPLTKRRAASGVRLSAHAEPAASKIKTTIANRVTIPHLPAASPRTAAVRSQGQCEQFNHADPNHQHGECYGIIVEPISSWVHDTPPLFPLISRAGRQTGSNVRWKW